MVELQIFLSVDILFFISVFMNQQTFILIFVANKSGAVEIAWGVLTFSYFNVSFFLLLIALETFFQKTCCFRFVRKYVF